MLQEQSMPVAPKERIIALDFLRGFALLGILLMNIQSFAMPFVAYFNPTAYGDLTGLNRLVWTFSHVLADSKFMNIFSILYGAGILLITQKLEAKGSPSAGLHYKRTFWLLIIGLVHAYLLWYGDILVTYALVAMVVYLFRKLSPRWLIALGILTLAVGTFLQLGTAAGMASFPPEVMADFQKDWMPDVDTLEHEVDAYQGSWLEQMADRVPSSIDMQTVALLFSGFWRAGGLMLIGMALFKWGVLTAERSVKFYLGLLIAGFGLGIPLVLMGITRNFAAGWSLEYSRFIGTQFNYWGSIGVSLGYIAIIMLIAKSGRWVRGIRPFASVGRMALSNYLFQTILATLIFYGYGLGLFGQVERTGQLLIVFGIWTIQLIISPIWLRYFRFGPAEWLWRSLTYGRLQPMKVQT
ncbi:MAG: DUF418 domain-containing protein [Chloroflexi bacterium]|nr:MAG: DUF418 domain-containing protein [Chloroflexota bacterium]MBL1196702.1 DUF418 domain-containing protein [Chloroflexota bacterium]NOH13995.1 DUF418 domain-containing protein [Chloroflexota bacterium]